MIKETISNLTAKSIENTVSLTKEERIDNLIEDFDILKTTAERILKLYETLSLKNDELKVYDSNNENKYIFVKYNRIPIERTLEIEDKNKSFSVSFSSEYLKESKRLVGEPMFILLKGTPTKYENYYNTFQRDGDNFISFEKDFRNDLELYDGLLEKCESIVDDAFSSLHQSYDNVRSQINSKKSKENLEPEI